MHLFQAYLQSVLYCTCREKLIIVVSVFYLMPSCQRLFDAACCYHLRILNQVPELRGGVSIWRSNVFSMGCFNKPNNRAMASLVTGNRAVLLVEYVVYQLTYWPLKHKMSDIILVSTFGHALPWQCLGVQVRSHCWM